MTRWDTGRAEVEALLASGDLEQVAPSPGNAARLLAEADRHPRSAELVAAADPSGGYDLMYAAARKAMAAALAVQGSRATSRGGHVAVQEAVTAQLGRSGAVVRTLRSPPAHPQRRRLPTSGHPAADRGRSGRGPPQGHGHRRRDAPAPPAPPAVVSTVGY